MILRNLIATVAVLLIAGFNGFVVLYLSSTHILWVISSGALTGGLIFLLIRWGGKS